MEIHVSSTAERLAVDIEEFVETMVASGVEPKNIKSSLKRDFVAGGRIFGAFTNGVKRNISNGVEMAGNIASEQTYKSAGVDDFMWVTASKNPCPDCADRAGLTGDISYFSTIGLPKSGFSVCRQHCQCQLVKSSYTAEGETIIKEK